MAQTTDNREAGSHALPASDENALVARCQQGDREAFHGLFVAYKDRVYRLALVALAGDTALAEDVTQEVFVRLYTRIGQFRHRAEFSTWLYRLVVNACRDEQRRERRTVSLNDATLENIAPTQHQPFAAVEMQTALTQALAELKPEMRLPLLLKYFDDLSYEEIARELHCSKGTVASRLNRSLKALARKLEFLRPDSKE